MWRKTAMVMACALLAAPGGAQAQDNYPSRAIRMVVPFGAGGPDTTARILAQQLGKQLGQSIVVENRPGANGIIGSGSVAKAAPDGYTMLLTSASFVVNPNIYKELPFDPKADFIGVAQIAAGEGMILAVNPAVPANTVEEFIALARKPESRMTYGSPGVGNTVHLAGAFFTQLTGTQMLHVPYKGGAPAATALLSGEVQSMLMTAPTALPQIRQGKLRALAFSGKQRASFLPDVPTMAEVGLADFDIDAGWHGLFVPAGTPAAIVERLRGEVRKALASKEMSEAIRNTGLLPSSLPPEDFPRLIRDDIAKYAKLVEIAKVEKM